MKGMVTNQEAGQIEELTFSLVVFLFEDLSLP